MKTRTIKWIRFIIGIGGLYVITQIAIPSVVHYSNSEMIKFIQQEEIDTTPLFYTESERGVEAIIQ